MKRLYRSVTDRRIAGVAGGLAEYFNIDVFLIRILWIALLFLGTIGLWIYLIAWFIIPENPGTRWKKSYYSSQDETTIDVEGKKID
jgi:phage shock protein PspC (stress-responsive transcriptional regulator)